ESNGAIRLGADNLETHYLEEVRLFEKLGLASESKVVRAFFTGHVFGLPGVLGVSRRTERHSGQVYENAIYMTNQLGVDMAGQTVAHELGHVLLNRGHWSEVPPNIMHYDHTRQNMEFDSEQCAKMVGSPLLKGAEI
ncbi:MAG: hypothetical protein AAF202_14105, partial [Pseudomonadota bacterium]